MFDFEIGVFVLEVVVSDSVLYFLAEE